MLVLSRKPGERILIGDEIVVTVVRFNGGTVRLGIEAPRDYAVIREELSQTIDSQADGTTKSPLTKTIDIEVSHRKHDKAKALRTVEINDPSQPTALENPNL